MAVIERPTRPPATRRRRVRRIGLVALASLVAYALIGLPFFVFPAQGPLPAHADVALVLGPALPERMATAERLQADGVVSHVIVSVPVDRSNPSRIDPVWAERCATLVESVCVTPHPYTTQGEARILRAQSALHGYRSAIVITQTAHLARARTIIGRCFPGTITMHASGEAPSGGWVHEYLYQTAATLKAWFVTNTC